MPTQLFSTKQMKKYAYFKRIEVCKSKSLELSVVTAGIQSMVDPFNFNDRPYPENRRKHEGKNQLSHFYESV